MIASVVFLTIITVLVSRFTLTNLPMIWWQKSYDLEAMRDLYPVPRWTPEYHCMKASVSLIVEMRGGVLAALSKLMYATFLPEIVGT